MARTLIRRTSDAAALTAAGCELRYGDITGTASLREAAEGADAGALLERFLSELEGGQTRGRHDPRVIVACLTSATMGDALFGPFIRRGVGLDEGSDAGAEAAMVAVLQDVARLAFGE